MKTATKLRETRFDTFVAKKSQFSTTNWKFGLPTKVAPLFMKKNTPKTIKKRHRNHTLFFPRAEWHRMDFDQDRINFLHFAQDRNLYLAYLVLEVLTPPPPPGPTYWAYLGLPQWAYLPTRRLTTLAAVLKSRFFFFSQRSYFGCCQLNFKS